MHPDKHGRALKYLTDVANAYDPVEGEPGFSASTWGSIRNAIYEVAQSASSAERQDIVLDLLYAARRVWKKYGHDEAGVESDWTEWTDLRDAIKAIQDPTPNAAVPIAWQEGDAPKDGGIYEMRRWVPGIAGPESAQTVWQWNGWWDGKRYVRRNQMHGGDEPLMLPTHWRSASSHAAHNLSPGAASDQGHPPPLGAPDDNVSSKAPTLPSAKELSGWYEEALRDFFKQPDLDLEAVYQKEDRPAHLYAIQQVAESAFSIGQCSARSARAKQCHICEKPVLDSEEWEYLPGIGKHHKKCVAAERGA